jgi:hypothetical protein
LPIKPETKIKIEFLAALGIFKKSIFLVLRFYSFTLATLVNTLFTKTRWQLIISKQQKTNPNTKVLEPPPVLSPVPADQQVAVAATGAAFEYPCKRYVSISPF